MLKAETMYDIVLALKLCMQCQLYALLNDGTKLNNEEEQLDNK